MVKILGKRKKVIEPIVKGNGKIIIKSFSGLKLDDFQSYYDLPVDDQLWLASYDGRIFINSDHAGYEALSDIFEIFLPYPKRELEQYRKKVQNKFPHVKTLADWLAIRKNIKDEDSRSVLAALLIPIELQRRETERKYYYK